MQQLSQSFDIEYQGLLCTTAMHKLLNDCDYVISYLSFKAPDYLNTKIIDGASMNKPILAVSSVDNYVFRFIEKNKLGKGYLINENFKFSGFPKKRVSSKDIFSHEKLTNKLINIIED